MPEAKCISVLDVENLNICFFILFHAKTQSFIAKAQRKIAEAILIFANAE
jgi:hypothetical protein